MVLPGPTEIGGWASAPALSRHDPARDARGSLSLGEERALGQAAGPVRELPRGSLSTGRTAVLDSARPPAEQGPLAATSARPRCARRAARGGPGTGPGSHVVKRLWRTRWV